MKKLLKKLFCISFTPPNPVPKPFMKIIENHFKDKVESANCRCDRNILSEYKNKSKRYKCAYRLPHHSFCKTPHSCAHNLCNHTTIGNITKQSCAHFLKK